VIKIGALLAVPPTSHIFLLTIKSNSGDINNKSNNNETGVDKEYLKIPMQTKISFGEDSVGGFSNLFRCTDTSDERSKEFNSFLG